MKTQNTKNQYISTKKANIVVDENIIYTLVKYLGLYIKQNDKYIKIIDINFEHDFIILTDEENYETICSPTTLQLIKLYIKK